MEYESEISFCTVLMLNDHTMCMLTIAINNYKSTMASKIRVAAVVT